MKQRGFEIAKGWEDKEIHLPKRNTKYSAGYDIEAAEDVVIPPFQLGQKPVLVPTGLFFVIALELWTKIIMEIRIMMGTFTFNFIM